MFMVVTGAQGFLGRKVLARLAQQGHQLVAVDRNPVVNRPLDGVTYHVSDLSDPETLLPGAFEGLGPFVLVHLAWDMRRPDAAYHIQASQVSLLAGLLDAWGSEGLHYLIAPGSAQEYGAQNGVLQESMSPREPLTPYGWAKHSACSMAASWAERTGVGLLWLRPFIVYGPEQTGAMLVPYAIRQALSKQPADFTDGEQLRDFVFVDDVVSAIVSGVERQLAGLNIVNLGGEEPVRVRDVLSEVARLYDAEGLWRFGARPRRQGEPEIQVADISRAKNLLDWRPTVPWREGLHRVWAQTQAGGGSAEPNRG